MICCGSIRIRTCRVGARTIVGFFLFSGLRWWLSFCISTIWILFVGRIRWVGSFGSVGVGFG